MLCDMSSKVYKTNIFYSLIETANIVFLSAAIPILAAFGADENTSCGSRLISVLEEAKVHPGPFELELRL